MSDVLKLLRERGASSTHWRGYEDSHLDCVAVLEIERLRRELDEARAALIDADHNLPLDEPPYFFGWRERHGKALKAAREVKP